MAQWEGKGPKVDYCPTIWKTWTLGKHNERKGERKRAKECVKEIKLVSGGFSKESDAFDIQPGSCSRAVDGRSATLYIASLAKTLKILSVGVSRRSEESATTKYIY